MDERQPLQYVAPAPLDRPGDKCRIEETDNALFITIPPPKLWILLAGPAVGLAIASIPLAVFGYVIFWQTQGGRGLKPEALDCSLIAWAVFGSLALYNLVRMIRAGRHGRKSIHIVVTPAAITIEDGSVGSTPESIAANEFKSLWVQESSPTLTLGKIVQMKFEGTRNYVELQFYTREWNIAAKLKGIIYAYMTARASAQRSSMDDHAAC